MAMADWLVMFWFGFSQVDWLAVGGVFCVISVCFLWFLRRSAGCVERTVGGEVRCVWRAIQDGERSDEAGDDEADGDVRGPELHLVRR